jgi:hypothetical protein
MIFLLKKYDATEVVIRMQLNTKAILLSLMYDFIGFSISHSLITLRATFLFSFGIVLFK